MTQLAFGEWLRRERRALDLSRKALAAEIGCAEITLRRIEAGELRPSRELAAIILQRMGVPLAELEPWLRYARGLTDLPGTTPATSAAPVLTNLPTALTEFIGRDVQQAEIIDRLRQHRLVTLTGLGGMGKTRLALRVGERLLQTFRNGVWWVELDALSSPDLLAPAIASALGLPPSPAPLETITNALSSRAMLLILDNCEHLRAACADITETLLKRCTTLRILTTSREALGVLGEVTYAVPAFDVAEPATHPDSADALRLFESCVRRARPGFALTPENTPHAIRICQTLDGIPLAIELAAAQTRWYAVEEVAAQLPATFALLDVGTSEVESRRQALRASLNWSWRLLSESEQQLLAQLSVFAGGWTLASAEAVCQITAPPKQALAVLIGQLASKSLVIANVVDSRPTRFRFHEVVRQYAADWLATGSGADELAQRHAAFFLAMAETAATTFHTADENNTFDQLSQELPNLRAALTFYIQHMPPAALRMAGTLGWFWFRRGRLSEGRDWLARAFTAGADWIAQWPALSRGQATDVQQATYAAGLLAHYQGDYATAQTMLEQSLQIAQALEVARGIAQALALLGMGYAWRGDFATAERYNAESQRLFDEDGTAWEQAGVRSEAGFMYLIRGDYTRAQPVLEAGLRLARQSQDPYVLGALLSNVGTLAYQMGQVALGRQLLEESLAHAQAAQDPTTISWAMKELGYVALQQGDFARAAELFDAVLTECRNAGYAPGVADVLRATGELAARTHQPQHAQSRLREAIQLHHQLGDGRNIVLCIWSFAVLAETQQRWDLAARLLGAVDGQFSTLGVRLSPVEQAAFAECVARVRVALDDATFEMHWHEGDHMVLAELQRSLETLDFDTPTIQVQTGTVEQG